MALHAVTANRLNDGVVVYFASGGSWSEHLEDAAKAETGADADGLLSKAEADQLLVVGPYLIEIVGGDGDFGLANVRERIRAAGPTVRTDLGKQAGN
jgi:hypothetical protein